MLALVLVVAKRCATEKAVAASRSAIARIAERIWIGKVSRIDELRFRPEIETYTDD
jgi:hypothetical protein